MPQILDQYGRPIDTNAIREPQTAMVANLQNEFDDHPAKGLTPARINAIMRAAEQGDLIKQMELADDMEERDGQIFSELSKRKLALIKLDWDLLPPENPDAAEKKMTDQVKEWIQAIPNFKRRVLHNMMDGVLKGFANIEMWWELQEGFLQPQLEFRPQRWFTLNEERNRITLRATTSSYGVPLNPFNWIAHLHPSRNGYLARQSLCRVLMLPYLYKNYSTRDFAEFLEIYGLPLRLGKYATGASDEEKRRLLQAVVEIGHNAAGIIPMGTEIDFQNASSGTEVPFAAMMERMDAIQSKVILGQTLTSGEGQHGTQALGNVHNEVRLDILAADAELVGESVSCQLVAPMALLNIAGANPKRLPRFHIEVPEPEDLAAFATNMPRLAAAGMRIGVKYSHERLNIPEADSDEEILQGDAGGGGPAGDPAAAAAGAGSANPAAKPGGPTPARSAAAQGKGRQPPAADKGARKPGSKAALSANVGGEPAPARDLIDDVVDEAAGDWQPLMQPMVAPLLADLDAAIAAGESLQAFRARLPGLIEQMDSAPMGERLARASFAARLAGEADLDLDTTGTDA